MEPAANGELSSGPRGDCPGIGAPEIGRLAGAGLVLVAWSLAIYLPVMGHEFLEWDDYEYVVRNTDLSDGLTWELISRAFTRFYAANWHPLTILSFALDISLFGMNPGALHATNLAIHLANVVLLLVLLYRLSGRLPESAFAAAIFAIHPQHVEAVAWISSRKDVLSMAFLLVGLHSHISYARSGALAWYACTLAALTLGLLSKPVLVVAPMFLLLLDYWPLARISSTRDLVRRARQQTPLIALCTAVAAITYWAQASGGAMRTIAVVPIADRFTNAAAACARSLGQTVWPAGLSIFYPRDAGVPAVEFAFACLVLAGITALAVYTRRTYPGLLFSWGWFVAALLPVAGFVSVGVALTADRYAYLAHVGPSIGLVWLARFLLKGGQVARSVSMASGVALLAAVSLVSNEIVPSWRNDITVFSRATALGPPNVVALVSLGNGYRSRGWDDEALDSYRKAAALAPERAELHQTIGVVEARRGACYAARDAFARAHELDREFEPAVINLAAMNAYIDGLESTAQALEIARETSPRSVAAAERLGAFYTESGQPERALLLYASVEGVSAVRWASAYARAGDLDSAIAAYGTSVREFPGDPAIAFERIRTLNRAGQRNEARREALELTRTRPEYAELRRYSRAHGW